MQAIESFLLKLKSDLAANMKATGQDKRGNIGNSLRVEMNETGGTLFGWKWITQRIETGRGATSPNTIKGNPTLREKIYQWVERNGIGEPKRRKSIAYLISRKIHEQGDALYRGESRYGAPPTGTLTSILNDGRIERLKKEMAVEIKEQIIIK